MDQANTIAVYRGDYVESNHNVHIAIVQNGELIAAVGDPYRLTFGRSSMKPFQAIPIVESGALENFNITTKELALFCASHNGEAFHRKAVKEVLQKIHLDENDLQCGTHIPRRMESYEKLLREGGKLTPFYSNCSGKHAGMLVGIVQKGLETENYRDLVHPYQQEIIKVISDVTSCNVDDIGISVDGCGVPVHRLPLTHLAMAFGRLALPEQWSEGSNTRKETLNRLKLAMVNYPEMVAGTDMFDTDLMKACKGRIVAKLGAEGVHCFGDVETGIGVAVKVEDGNERATSVASMEILHQLNIGDQVDLTKLYRYHHGPIHNSRKEIIGEMRPNFRLKYN